IVPIESRAPNNSWRWLTAACSLGLVAGSIWWFTQRPPAAPLALADPPAQKAKPVLNDTLTGTAPAPPPVAEAKPETKTSPAKPAEQVSPEQQQPVAADEIITSAPLASTDFKAKKIVTPAGDIPPAAFTGRLAAGNPVQSIENKHNKDLKGVMMAQPVAYIEGKVTDDKGTPLRYATVSAPGNRNITTQNDGSFVLPAYDSSFKVSVSMDGFNNAIASLRPGERNNIVLNKTLAPQDEIVVVGYGA